MTERELYPTPRDESQAEATARYDERSESRQATQPVQRFADKQSGSVPSGGQVSRGYKLMFFDLDEA